MVKVDSLVKLHALISLNNKEKNGYELMKEVEEKTNKKISASHIYPFLKELKENYLGNKPQVYYVTGTSSSIPGSRASRKKT